MEQTPSRFMETTVGGYIIQRFAEERITERLALPGIAFFGFATLPG
jgi:hypothetical protein